MALAFGLYGAEAFDIYETSFLKRDDLLHGATYDDLDRGVGPPIVASATDITTGGAWNSSKVRTGPGARAGSRAEIQRNSGSLRIEPVPMGVPSVSHPAQSPVALPTPRVNVPIGVRPPT